MRGRHPDDDLLADLAADVLPLDEARVVEAHVLGCRECSSVLADAEKVRRLLLAGDPGPMPAEVWNRIEATLTTAAAPPVRPQARAGGRRRVLPAVFAVAAATLLVVGLGTALRIAGTGGASAGSGGIAAGAGPAQTSAAAAAGTAAAARYLSSGTRYTSSALAAQARALSAKSVLPAPAAAGAEATPRASRQAGSPYAVAGGTVNPLPSGRVPAPNPSATDITNPSNLAGCLQALAVSPAQLVAVDLATFDGREAAILLLHAPGGGYEVFAVERTCSATDDHTLGYTTLNG